VTNQSSAESFVPQIEEQLLALSQIKEKTESINQSKGPLCSEALEHAIACGKFLKLAKESATRGDNSGNTRT
jgi:hypothetical protein